MLQVWSVWWMLKSVVSVREEIRYFIVSEYFSKIFVNYVGKTGNFTVENLCRHLLSQVIKVNKPPATNHIEIIMHWDGHNITSGLILLKMKHLKLIMRKHQTNPSWKTFYKLSRSWKTKKDWETITDCRKPRSQ